jgi:hypothetical protein
LWLARRTRSRRSSHVVHDTAPIQLLAIGLEEFSEIFFAEIFYIAAFISNVSFTAIANGRDRSAGDVTMPSSISGSENTDVKNLYPKH